MPRSPKTTFVPRDVECKLVDFCIALRSLNFPIFKKELIAYCNNLIQGTQLVSLFKHAEVRDSWYYNWLRRYHERLGTAAVGFVQGQSHADPRNPFSPYLFPQIAQSEQEMSFYDMFQGEKNFPRKIRENFGKILTSQNETLQNDTKLIGDG